MCQLTGEATVVSLQLATAMFDFIKIQSSPLGLVSSAYSQSFTLSALFVI